MLQRVPCARTFQSSLLWVLWFTRFGTLHGPTRWQLWQLHHSLRLRLGRLCVATLVIVVSQTSPSHPTDENSRLDVSTAGVECNESSQQPAVGVFDANRDFSPTKGSRG